MSRSLVTHLKPLGCLQDDFIYIYGQIAEDMYFIVKGGVELIKGDGSLSATLTDGSYFGGARLYFGASTSYFGADNELTFAKSSKLEPLLLEVFEVFSALAAARAAAATTLSGGGFG